MDIALLITLFVAALGIGLGLALFRIDSKARKAFLDRIATELTARRTRNGGEGIAGSHQYRYEVLTRTSSEGTGGGGQVLRVYLRATIPADIIIEKRSAIHTASESSGILKSFRTGNEPFDREFVVLALDEPFASSQLGAADGRDQVRRLFYQYGMTKLAYSVDDQAIVAECSRYAADDTCKGSAIKETIDLLASLKSSLPTDFHKKWKRSSAVGVREFLPIYMVLLSIFGFGVLFGIPVDIAYEPLDRGDLLWAVVFGSALALLGLWLYARWQLRNNIERYKYMIGLMAVGLLSCPVAVYLSIIYVNGAFDNSPAAVTIVKLMGKEKIPSNGTFDYLIYTSAWNNSEARQQWRVPYQLYSEITEDTAELEVAVHQGFLRVPWLNKKTEMRVVQSDSISTGDKITYVPLRFYQPSLEFRKAGQNMACDLSYHSIETEVLPEINEIWRGAKIQFTAESVISSAVVDRPNRDALVDEIVNSARDAAGNADPDRIKALSELIDFGDEERGVINIYLVPYLGEKSQGHTRAKRARIFIGCWTDKHRNSVEPPERFPLVEAKPFKNGSLSRTIAHEIGHVFGLEHPDKQTQTQFHRLMGGKRPGYELTESELETARRSAQRFANVR